MEKLDSNEFFDALSRISSAWSRGDLIRAFSEIDAIKGCGTPDMKAEAIWFSGMIKESEGANAGARADWLEAVSLCQENGFIRHNIQLGLAKSYEAEKEFDKAEHWYRMALETSITGEEFSSARLLELYLSFNNGRIPAVDVESVVKAVQRSWRVLNLPGDPPVNNLPFAVRELEKQTSQAVHEIIGSSP